MEYTHITHPFGPLFDENSRILILGSLPSVKSREVNFFYGHPQNRYWKLVASLLEEPEPATVEEKRALMLKHHIAMWDTIMSCDIRGSSDASIKNVTPTDLTRILGHSGVGHIFCNGKTSWNYFHKYQEKTLGMTAEVLPSTSPANAAWSLERLKGEWQKILAYL